MSIAFYLLAAFFCYLMILVISHLKALSRCVDFDKGAPWKEANQMTPEEQSAVAWWSGLSDEDLKQLILKSYRQHLEHAEELKALGFTYGVS